MKTPTLAARVAACLALLNLSVPGGALVAFGVPLRESAEKALAQRAKDAKDLASRRAKSASRLLTAEEERSLQGRAGENPYLAGQSKWDVVYKGVNLMTGNFSTSATDLSFDGGYGIPVNVTRSYSANNADDGPFGKGWTLSADVRSTAGGLLKSGSAPVRAVPVGFKERPSAETDPNAQVATGGAAQPVEAVIATDAGGEQETVQKDVDGVLTTPPWDTNVNENTQYEYVTQGTATYQVMTHNETVTVEGTRYVYDRKGWYLNGGVVPWGSTGATAEPANVMKVTSATDRQGNVTTYTYGAGYVDYVKSNGTTHENPLTQVSMPGGHVIQFAFGTTGAATGRVVSITDFPGGGAAERKVEYAYGVGGLLASAKTPGGKITTYGYGSPDQPNQNSYSGPSATGLLTSVTDPRGLTTTVHYAMARLLVAPAMAVVGGPVVMRVDNPNQTYDWFGYDPSGSFDRPFGSSYVDGSNSMSINTGRLQAYASGNPSVLYVTMKTPQVVPVFQLAPRGAPYWEKEYDAASQSLSLENRYTYRGASIGYDGAHSLGTNNPYTHSVISTTGHNFMGAPLWKTTVERTDSGGGLGGTPPAYRTATVQYAYWGADKYFQQKAVKDQAGRVAFTDYYTSVAAAGKRGQTYRVYDPKNSAFSNANTSTWKADVVPASAAAYSAQFDYDSKGRPTDVWKLQKTSPSWTYVQTRTTYGADGSPGWGQASQVVEDYGASRINRATQTMAYTSWGKACDVQDAKGQRFLTDFDKDGLVNSVKRTDGGLNQAVVFYTYGTTAGTLENGQPLTVADGLSGVTQSIAYAPSGGGKGQPASVTETNGTDQYTTSYTYGPAGDRATATYATPSGTTGWGYSQYVTAGTPESPSRPFTALTRLTALGAATSEEMHYAYDSAGRLVASAFAQTPQSGQTNYLSASAASRARTEYAYDPAGRLLSTATYWDRQGQPTEAVLRNDCDYELSGANRGLKTSSSFYAKNPSSPAQFAPERTETYGYDALNDWLTEAHYADGNLDPNPTRAYDAAGNRSDTVVDNLNRATTLYPGFTATNDILGNRTSKTINGNTFEFGWDCLNRMVSHGRSMGANPWIANYAYRSDGMRVSKSVYGKATRYRHDGQMGIEDVETTSSATTVTRYGLGARGVDLIERTDSSGVTTGFPLYDAHGNMVATLARNGSGYTVGDRRIYSAWGDIRGPQVTGDPKGRYCANLGHKADDESGMVYMRARYYEPTTGRFISQDPAMDGHNWFVYAANNPVSNVDITGKNPLVIIIVGIIVLGGLVGGFSELIKQFRRTGEIYSVERIAIQTLKGVVMAATAELGLWGGAIAFLGAGCGLTAFGVWIVTVSVLLLCLENEGFDEWTDAVCAERDPPEGGYPW